MRADLVGKLLRVFIRAYQLVLSPVIGPRCRHLPTCSEYASEAIEMHGPGRGVWLAVRRLARCHPWGTSGYDPVPGVDGQAPRRGPARARGRPS